MNLKDTKIFIPEIPKEWEDRVRSGHTNIWNERSKELPKVKLNPPMLGLYAKRFEDGWYWVCDCPKCLGKYNPYPYIVCDEHNRCETCGIHRNDLKEKGAWGVPGGWQCYDCHDREHEERKSVALEQARENEHSEDDCYYTNKIICPVCASENSRDDMRESGEHEVTCNVCDEEFTVEIEYDICYTSYLKQKEV